MILIGQLTDSLGATHYIEPVADHRDPGGWRVRHTYQHQPLELRSTTEDVALTDGHAGRRLGTVKHIEITPRGAWIAADVTEPLPAGDHHGKLYLSAEGTTRGEDFNLRAVAITDRPAMILAPVQVFAGTIDELPEAATLRMRTASPHSAALLERARTAARAWPPRATIHIHDRRPPEPLEPGMGWIDADGKRIPASTRTGAMAYDDNGKALGQLWIRPSRILSVGGYPARPR